MLKIEFTNAQVEDNGYGLKVNGKDLDKIISTALGTRVGDKAGYGSGIPSFESNCCNVTIIIDPQPLITHIEDDDTEYFSVEELEEDMRGKYQEKAGEAKS